MERRCGWRPGLGLLVLTAGFASASEPAAPPARAVPLLEAKDVFELEWAANPEISPDGQSIVYQRHWMDVMTDRRRSSLWIVGSDGRDHRPVGAGDDAFLPRWSPDGRRLLYAAREGQAVQLYVRYQDTGQTARLTHVLRAPSSASWSPDGRSIAFTMLVPARAEPFAVLPEKPEGATWADPPKVIQRLVYRADGEGYLENGYVQLFLLPAEGGTPRVLTTGDLNVTGRPVFAGRSSSPATAGPTGSTSRTTPRSTRWTWPAVASALSPTAAGPTSLPPCLPTAASSPTSASTRGTRATR